MPISRQGSLALIIMKSTLASPRLHPMNAQVAAQLDEAARLLELHHADTFRVQAYRNAATTIRGLERNVLDLLHEEGQPGLEALPTIGPALARSINQIVKTGRLPMLDRLRAELDPVAILSSVPGVGPRLAERLHDQLDISTLEGLELAAHDGSLAALPGFGVKRIAGIRDVLAARLGRVRAAGARPVDEPPVDELLDVDREYRAAARAGRLHRIAPRRFNPDKQAWLPVMHTWRDGRHYTALFSNTARAHALDKTRDWVVVYGDEPDGQGQHTVVTATSGLLTGHRVVRGREPECEAYYRVA